MRIKITAHKFCPEDKDFTIPVEPKLKTREDFMRAMKHVKNADSIFIVCMRT